MSTMAYKWNYLVGFGLNVIGSAADLLYIWYVFYVAGIELIAGIDYIKFFFVFGLFEFSRSIMRAMVMDNSYSVQEGIHSGELDEFIIKPVNFKFITSVRFFWPEQMLMGLAALVFLLVLGGMNGFFAWGILDFVWLFFIVASSVTVSFLFIWIVTLMAFYWDRFNQIKSIFWIMSGASYYPRKIYPGWMQWVGIYLVPIFVIINPMYDLFEGNYDWVNVLNATLYILVLWIVYQLLWRAGLRRYNSAN